MKITIVNDVEQRLDRLLLAYCQSEARYAAMTRSQLKNLIEREAVSVNGKIATKAGVLVQAGALVEIREIPSSSDPLIPHKRELEVIHEDAQLLVLNKPAGVSVHPGAGDRSATIVNALLARNSDFVRPFEVGTQRPGIVHRLDKDTSGVLVIAKTPAAHAALAAQFADRTTEKLYAALVLSTPRGGKLFREGSERGSFEGAIGRDASNRRRMAVVKKGGKEALTHWTLVERMSYAALVDVRLGTGRTHQIRVHFAHAGAPLVGDPLYGSDHTLPQRLRVAVEGFGRQALHARSLSFVHPATGERSVFTAPLPSDFVALLEFFKSEAP